MWLLLYVPLVQQTSNCTKPQLFGSLRCTATLPEQDITFTNVPMEDPSFLE
jgi:hypothetical protein